MELRFNKNELLKSVNQLIQVTEKLIEDQTEINDLTTIVYRELTWRSTSSLCDNAFEITNAKSYVFADSVLRLGSMRDQLVEAWKNKIKWHLGKPLSKRSDSDRWRADGIRVEKILRIHYVGHT